MEGYGPRSYGDAFAAVYDDWYADVSDAEATADFLADRVRGHEGPVVELGVGTGRLAGPLAARSVVVVGIDASLAMLARCRALHPDVVVIGADMVEPPLRPRLATAVLVGFNTLFNLPTPAEQRRCLTAARHLLADEGVVVVEAFVPDDRPAGTVENGDAAAVVDRVEVSRLELDRVVLRVSRTDHAAGTVSGHHVDLRDGRPVRLRPWHLRFCSPDDLDDLAAAAGLDLAERHGGWKGEPFDESSAWHVSVYRARAQPAVNSPR